MKFILMVDQFLIEIPPMESERKKNHPLITIIPFPNTWTRRYCLNVVNWSSLFRSGPPPTRYQSPKSQIYYLIHRSYLPKRHSVGKAKWEMYFHKQKGGRKKRIISNQAAIRFALWCMFCLIWSTYRAFYLLQTANTVTRFPIKRGTCSQCLFPCCLIGLGICFCFGAAKMNDKYTEQKKKKTAWNR